MKPRRTKSPHEVSKPTPRLPERQVSTGVTFTHQQQVFAGPLPHPEVLAKFNEVVPGLADRIVAMAEKEQDARIEGQSEERMIRTRGQWFGFILGLVALIGGGVLVALGHAAAGIGTMLSSAAILAGAFAVYVWNLRKPPKS